MSNEVRPQTKTRCHPEAIRSGCPKDLNVQFASRPIPQAPAPRRHLQLLAPAALLLAALAIAPTARCQGDTEFGVWGGYSVGTPHLIGITSNRQLGVLALRYGHSIYDWSNVSLQYTLDIIPIEFINQPKYVSCNTNPNNFPTGFCEVSRENVYGGGVNPLGLKLNFRRKHRFQIIGASTAGFIASQRPVPVDIPGGTQFNFNFDFQAGFQLFNSSRSRAWTLAYKYQHISNGYRHDFNPGLDLHMLSLGYSFFK